jgi:hypothetical protein
MPKPASPPSANRPPEVDETPGKYLRPGRVIGWLLAIVLAGMAAYYILQQSG